MRVFGKKVYFSVIIALLGLAGGLAFSFTKGDQPPPPSNHLSSPPATPYTQSVSGTGIVEANTRNIAVGSFVSGIVSDLLVNEGDKVKVGDILFVIDKLTAKADLEMRKKEVASNEAALASANTQLADAKDLLARYDGLKSGVGISTSDKERQKFAVRKAQAQVEQARAGLASSKAVLDSAKVLLDQHTVYSPIDGEVLKVRVRKGEFVTSGVAPAPIVVGNTEPMNLRVQVDENDLWRFNQKSSAIAYLRSNKDIKYNLKLVRIEPLVIPKIQLSGDAAEKVDTRIMEVVYSVEPQENSPLFVGQQLDVFVDADK